MATGKRFYWIKLKENFMTSDTVDYLMSQKNGANYVVLYQMLCLKTMNTNGNLSRKLGEIIVPYDVEKIQRDCKYFSIDTIRIALELYKNLGLIYLQNNGTLQISNYENLVGSETDYAIQKREQRKAIEEKRILKKYGVDKCVDNFHIDNRDRYKDIDKKEIYKEKSVVANAPKRDLNKEKLEEILSSYSFSKSINEAIDTWLQYKKEKKQTYKATGLKTLLNKIKKQLETNGEQYVIDCIENTISNNWQGIVWKEKKQFNNKYNNQVEQPQYRELD